MHDSVQELLKDVARPTEDRTPQLNAVSVGNTENSGSGSVKAGEDTETKPQLTAEAIENGADLMIGLYDVGQTATFRFFVRRKKDRKLIKMYGEEALQQLADLNNELDAAENDKARITEIRSLTPKEMAMLRLAREADEIIGDIRLSDAEKDLIKPPLMAMMKEKGVTLPPGAALIFAFGQIIAARVTATATL